MNSEEAFARARRVIAEAEERDFPPYVDLVLDVRMFQPFSSATKESLHLVTPAAASDVLTT
jgi:hypothetical protein